MAVTLSPEQEQVLIEAVNSGLAQDASEALDQALDALRVRLPGNHVSGESTAVVVRRLASFGKRHGLSLGDMTVKDLLRESRP